MQYFVIMLAWGLLWAGSACATDITWLGDRPDDIRVVERRLKALDASAIPVATLADSANSWLQALGYLDVETFALESEVSIAAGPRCYLRQITAFDTDTTATVVATRFTPDNVAAAMDRLLSPLRDRGYPYARADLREIVRDGTQVDIVVRIDRGPMVRITSLDYRGLTRTRRDVIARYLDFAPGDSLTDDGIIALEQRAADIPFVRHKPPAVVECLPGYTDAVVTMVFEEKRQFNLSGGAGYLPGEDNGVVWNLDVRLVNLFGSGRELQVQSERRERRRNNLRLGYAQPLFLLGPDRLSLEVSTRDYRDDFYEFNLSAAYNTLYRRNLSTGLALGWKRVEPADEGASYAVYSVEFSLGRSNVTDPLNPRSGYDIAAALGYAYRRYADQALSGDGEAYNETRAKLSAGFYQPLAARLVGHVSANYRGLETGEPAPPLSELFLIGGPGTLRGWRNEQFAAQRTAYGTLETRWRFDRAYLFAFCDGAYVNRRLAGPDGAVTDELYRSGFGLGAAVIDGDRSAVLSLGWNDRDGIKQPRLSVEFSADL